MKSKSDITQEVWKYLIIFSVVILGFICVFQLVFFDSYYLYSKNKSVNNVLDKIEENYKEEDFTDTLDSLAYAEDVCILISNKDETLYSSSGFNKSCFLSPNNAKLYLENRLDFIQGDLDRKIYNVENTKNNDSLVLQGLKLDDNLYAFVLTSVEPVNATTHILSNQILIVAIIALILSLILAYFISKLISTPIININNKVKKMSKGNLDVDFSTDSNIEEIIELSDTLDKTQNELRKTEEVRKELLANVSHDLKTPLTMIRAYSEMVRDITFEDEEKRVNNLNIIIDETDRLNLLVNDILELTKMQSNVSELEIEKFDLNAIIKTIIEKFEYTKIKFEYKNTRNLLVEADLHQIDRVIYNLVSNAVDHVGEDKTLEIKIVTKKAKYIVKVIDHGKGIDEDEIDLIWDKYYKADKTYKRSAKSTGLGLSIVKSILVKHGFDYGVESKSGKTTFYFEIKRAK